MNYHTSIKKARPRWRRRGNLILAVLVFGVLAVLAVNFLLHEGEDGPLGRPEGKPSLAPESGAHPNQVADLESGDDEFDADNAPLIDPGMYSDPAASRRFTPVDDAGIAAVLDPEIEKEMKTGRIPSLVMVLISGDRMVWTRSAGLANIRVKTPAACDTVYVIGSTFKTMSTMALLQLMEKGKFKLDDQVNNYLTEFKIENENKRYPVTFRRLLTHTSGLPTDFGRYPVWGDEGPKNIGDYLKGSLKLSRRTGSRVLYSNIAYTLVAYLVEKFSGVPFKEYMQKNIFEPLEMNDTAFEPRPDMAERLAIPYMPVSRRGVFLPVDWAKADVWPAGVVYGTAIDQARWLTAIINGGVYKGRRLLGAAAFREMMTKQYEKFSGPINSGWLNESTGFGLTWWISKQNGQTIVAHSGSINGYTAFLAGNLDRKIGVALVTNGHKAHRHLYPLALKALALLENRR